MWNSRIRIPLVILLLLILSLACSLTGGQEQPADSSEDAIATLVAATSNTEEMTPLPTQTEGPAATAEPNINLQGVSFLLEEFLAESAAATAVPGVDSEMWSTPDHRVIVLNGWVLPNASFSPEIRIYPVAEFRAANDVINESLDKLVSAIDAWPGDEDGIEVADYTHAARFIRCQVHVLEFQNGRGVRFLSQYGQDAYPIGWPNMFYTFQGFTEDGLYYISMILPVIHSSLPLPEDVTLDDEFYDSFPDYTAEVNDALDEKDPGSFMPSLTALDTLVESLSVGSPAAEGGNE